MTNDERFQALLKLGVGADVAHASMDDLERLRLQMRQEMTHPSHWPRLGMLKTLAKPSGGKSPWEASVAALTYTSSIGSGPERFTRSGR